MAGVTATWPDFKLDGSRVAWSRVILWRHVLNDVNVGPWTVFEPSVLYPGSKFARLFRHSMNGLKLWMKKNPGEQYDPGKLEREGWDKHVWKHGNALQFWVPDEEEDAPPLEYPMVCVDATGCDLTEGQAYNVIAEDDEGLLVVIDDSGVRREFLPDRFKEKT